MAKKKDAYYFSHDSNARNDPKILAMRSVYKRGYGWYWMIIEMFREQANYKLPLNKYTYEILSTQLQEKPNEIEKFVNDCIYEFVDDKGGLFCTDGKFLWSESFLRRMESMDDKSNKASESAQKRWINKNSNANALPTHSECNAINESKVNEIKINESKVNESPNAASRKTDEQKLDEKRMQITSRPLPTPLEIQAENEMLKLLPFEQIERVIEKCLKAYKPKYEGDKITSIVYFLPAVKQYVSNLSARAAPSKVVPINQPEIVDEELNRELAELAKQYFPKELINDG
jgi:hypothetical protein